MCDATHHNPLNSVLTTSNEVAGIRHNYQESVDSVCIYLCTICLWI